MTVPAISSRPKRIVALFTDLLGVGGVQQAGRMTSMALAEIARERGGTVAFLSLNDSCGTHRLDGADEIDLHGFARNKARFALGALRTAFGSSDGGVVIAGHPNLAPVAVWMRRVRPQLRVVVMSHGIEVWEPLRAHRRKGLQRADCVLAPSNYTARKLTEVQGVAAEKVRRLPWPIRPAFPALVRERGKLPVPAGFPRGRTVLTVGRWAANERYKGADALIRAVAALQPAIPDIQLVAVGTGDDLPRLRVLAAELKIEDRVHFLEKLSNEELAACYAHADVFALPSTGEGFGLVFLEAMVFAKPVVGVAAGGVTDIVRDGENGFLVTPGDAQRLSDALQTLMEDDSLRARLGAAGTEMVRREFSFEAFRSGLAEILSDCENAAGRA
ncbi:MAG TPA: glycosyltransferase family 4 protein [Candidatus Acidoferrales bacterium]|jgi:glycosyltransferase involved in cell wall biosynthesis|nr:glycosyltransferase family 4 protein [Candidatus Acidoferrales bacterium]